MTRHRTKRRGKAKSGPATDRAKTAGDGVKTPAGDRIKAPSSGIAKTPAGGTKKTPPQGTATAEGGRARSSPPRGPALPQGTAPTESARARKTSPGDTAKAPQPTSAAESGRARKTPPAGTAIVKASQSRATAAAEKVIEGLAAKASAGVAQKAAREVAGAVGTKLPGAVAAAQQQIASATSRQREARNAIAQGDEKHMRRALELAEQYRGRTAPNPIVGCVIVDARGDVIAEGVHRGPGTRHAEIDALDPLGGTAPGATLYVNLEPCTHQGRTPPCAPVVAAAKLARIVVGSLDPIAEHGGGAKRLAKLGIPVSRVLVEECDVANLAFTTASLTRRAAFTLKAAVTLDGKIATVGGESKWITGEAAREQVHRLRSTHDAVLVGIGTVLADDPELTARIDGGRDPVRIVIDTKLRTPFTAKLLPKQSGARTIIATTDEAPEGNARALAGAGAEIWRFPAKRGQVSLSALASRLAEENLYSVLVEGGGRIHASLLAEGLATDLQLFVAPRIVGGPAPSWIGGAGVAKLTDAWQLEFVGEPRRFGDDLLVRAVVRYRRA